MADNKLVVKIAETLASYKVTYPPERKQTISGSSLEGDGRRLKTLVRELRDEGYLTKDDPAHNEYTMTDLAWNQIGATAPDLGKLWEKQLESNRQYPSVVPWHALSLSEKKWALDNPQSYTFYIGKLWNGSGELAEYHPGTNEYWKLRDEDPRFRNGDSSVYVGNPDLDTHSTTFLRNKEVERVYKIALEGGLKHFNILPKGEQKVLSVGDSMCIFGGGEDMTFTPNPDKWESEVEAKVGACLDEIVKMTERLRILQTIQKGVKVHGGWAKFLSDYRTVVEETVDNKQES